MFPGTFPFSFPLEDLDETTGADLYARQLKALMPRGHAFNLERDSEVSATLEALAQELGRVDARGTDLIAEADPRTASETIGDWERMLSLPDALVPEIPTDLDDRRLVCAVKYTNRGGQDYQFFSDLVESCGYGLDSIDKFAASMLRAGFRVGDRCYDVTWAFTIVLNVTAPTGTALAQDDFERVIRHAAHSHIIVAFNYL
jgi:uncharacterized protein YmfQ (DUF2313 family)